MTTVDARQPVTLSFPSSKEHVDQFTLGRGFKDIFKELVISRNFNSVSDDQTTTLDRGLSKKVADELVGFDEVPIERDVPTFPRDEFSSFRNELIIEIADRTEGTDKRLILFQSDDSVEKKPLQGNLGTDFSILQADILSCMTRNHLNYGNPSDIIKSDELKFGPPVAKSASQEEIDDTLDDRISPDQRAHLSDNYSAKTILVENKDVLALKNGPTLQHKTSDFVESGIKTHTDIGSNNHQKRFVIGSKLSIPSAGIHEQKSVSLAKKDRAPHLSGPLEKGNDPFELKQFPKSVDANQNLDTSAADKMYKIEVSGHDNTIRLPKNVHEIKDRPTDILSWKGAKNSAIIGDIDKASYSKRLSAKNSPNEVQHHELIGKHTLSLPPNSYQRLPLNAEQGTSVQQSNQKNSTLPAPTPSTKLNKEIEPHPNFAPENDSVSNVTTSRIESDSFRSKPFPPRANDADISRMSDQHLGSPLEDRHQAIERSKAPFETVSKPSDARLSVPSQKQEALSAPLAGETGETLARFAKNEIGALVARPSEGAISTVRTSEGSYQNLGDPAAGDFFQGTGTLKHRPAFDGHLLTQSNSQETSTLRRKHESSKRIANVEKPLTDTPFERGAAQQAKDIETKPLHLNLEELLADGSSTPLHQSRSQGSTNIEALPADSPRVANFRNSFAQQIINVIGTSERNQVELNFSPEELGTVRIHITRNENTIALLLSAERPETLELFRRNIDDLSNDLHDLGFEDVEMKFSQDQRHERPNADFSVSDKDEPTDSDSPNIGRPLQNSQHTELDMRI